MKYLVKFNEGEHISLNIPHDVIDIDTPEDLLEDIKKYGGYVIGLKDYKSTYHYLVNKDIWEDFCGSNRRQLRGNLKNNYRNFISNHMDPIDSDRSLIHYELNGCDLRTVMNFMANNGIRLMDSCEVYE